MAVPRPPRPPRKRPDRYHHGDLPRALVQAGLSRIRAHGVDALTLRAVGEDLGVSRTALYRHFSDKAALLAAIAREGFRMLRLTLIDADTRAGGGRKGFEAMGEAYVRFALANPAHYRVMFGGALPPRCPDAALAQEGASAFQALVDALVKLQREGVVRRDEPLQLARFIWAIVHGIAMLAIDGQLQEPQCDVGTLASYAIHRVGTGIDL